jgi:hypothetical protein
MKKIEKNLYTLKNNQAWNTFHSNQKKTMVTNDSIEDFVLPPLPFVDDAILSTSTLMRYVQGLMPKSDREVVEAELLKKGNEFYIDAVKGLIKLLNKENGNAHATTNRLTRQADEKMSVFLLTKNEASPYSRHLKTTHDFVRERNPQHPLSIREVLDVKKPVVQVSALKNKNNHPYMNNDVNEPALLEVESMYPVEQ